MIFVVVVELTSIAIFSVLYGLLSLVLSWQKIRFKIQELMF
jgi:hypothetical protein